MIDKKAIEDLSMDMFHKCTESFEKELSLFVFIHNLDEPNEEFKKILRIFYSKGFAAAFVHTPEIYKYYVANSSEKNKYCEKDSISESLSDIKLQDGEKQNDKHRTTKKRKTRRT